MEISALSGESEIENLYEFDQDLKTKKGSPCDPQSTIILGSEEDLSFLRIEKIKEIYLKANLKPLMGNPRDGRVDVELGYSEREGVNAKIRVTWDFGESDKSKTEKESTSKEPGEVNTMDKN